MRCGCGVPQAPGALVDAVASVEPMPATRTLAALLASAAVAVLAACATPPVGEPIPEIRSALASQSQSTPGFDDETYAIDDPDALDELAGIVVRHGAHGEQVDETEGAPGARSTHLGYVTAEGDAIAIRFTLHDASTDFQRDVDALVLAWRTSGAFDVAIPPYQAPAIVAAAATQTSGPLGDGTEGLERTDDDALDAIADVRAMAQTEREDVECVWSTRTVVTLTFDDGSTEMLQADSCGATGRDRALGLLVAEWVDEEA